MEVRNRDRQDEARGLSSRIVIGVKGKARVGEAGIEKTQTAAVDETTFHEHDITELPHCQCGALLHTIEEVAGVDISGDFLCSLCASAKCAHCLRSVGVQSRINLLGNVYCKKCALRLGIYALTVFVVVIAVVCLVIFM